MGGPYIHREKRGPERGSLGIRQQRWRMRPEPRSWCPGAGAQELVPCELEGAEGPSLDA